VVWRLFHTTTAFIAPFAQTCAFCRRTIQATGFVDSRESSVGSCRGGLRAVPGWFYTTLLVGCRAAIAILQLNA